MQTHNELIDWFFDEFNKRKEKFESGTKEKYNMETFFDTYGLNEPGSEVGTVQFFDHRTRQILDLYEFYKYQPHVFSRSKLWREAVVIMRRLEPKGGLF